MLSIFSGVCGADNLYVGGGGYTTIQAAVNAASAGDTILVQNGYYNESIVIGKSLTLKSVNGYANASIQGVDHGRAIVVSDANYVTIEGFSIYGAVGDWTECVVLDRSHYSTVRNNRIGWSATYKNDVGIRVFWSDGCLVSGNICSSNNYVGIEVYSGDNNTVYNNTCNGNGESGIEVWFGTGNRLDSNICSNNEEGINLAYADVNTLVGNQCSNNSQAGIDVYDSDGNSVRGNTCNSNGTSGWGILTGDSRNNRFIRNVLRYNNVGMTLLRSSGSFVLGNYMDDNNVGLELGESASFNVMYFNEFASNSLANLLAAPGVSNTWNSSQTVLYHYGASIPPNVYMSPVGNYYGHHSGTDTNGNGILDNPFSPFAGQWDYYPLAGPLISYSGDLVVSYSLNLAGGYQLVFDSLTIADDAFGVEPGKLEISGGTVSIGTLLPPMGGLL